jgi:hypothetical protein
MGNAPCVVRVVAPARMEPGAGRRAAVPWGRDEKGAVMGWKH